MPHMRRHAALVALLVAFAMPSTFARGRQAAVQPAGRAETPAPASAAPAPSPRNANYSIDVDLDPASRTITGRAVVTWRNLTSKPTPELQFHTYWNAWRDTRSTWMREWIRAASAGDTSELTRRPKSEWASMDVTAIRLLAGGTTAMADLLGGAHYIAPDDGNRDDRTVLAVPLPKAVGPGETIAVEVGWTAHVPRTFARTGAVGNSFFIAQWFPKLGVLEDGGWNTHQFHASTEFFSDYGVYDVRMTVPRGWVVGATGVERSRTDTPTGRTVHQYVQEDVHDFAWTTSPDYIVKTEKFEHRRLQAVEMRLLIQPEHASQADRYFMATRATLRSYGEWYGPYPYGHITIIDPAFQTDAGGMEYPTLFTGGTSWLAPLTVTDPEDVTVHECGHQFWYGLVGNNEFEHAWIDEGLNTFSTARVIEETFSPNFYERRFFGGVVPWVFHDIAMPREILGDRLAGYRSAARSDTQQTPSWRYAPATGGAITYNKTALWLHTLERYLGWRRLQRGMSLFFTRSTFKHPTPEDFFSAINEGAGRDLNWYFDQVYRSSNAFDYAVGTLTTEKRGDAYHTEVMVQRRGEALFPVDVQVMFDDGSRVREHWDGRERWKLYTWDRRAAAVSAEVDPDSVLLLDIDRTNNSRTLAPQTGKAARQWTARWFLWLQDLVQTYAFFV
jgi:hypothetical protein